MTALLAVARAEVRTGWRALLLVGLLAGVVGATVIGSLSLARRTTTAYERLGEATGVDDARGTVIRHVDLLDDITALPEVTASWTGRIGVAQLDGTFAFLGLVAGPERPSPLAHPLLLEGRLPSDDGDPDTAEIALRDDFQREFEVPLGTEVPVRFLTEADYFRFDTGFEGGAPHGPQMTLRVVGTFRLAGGYASLPPGLGGPDLLERDDAMVGGAYFVRLAGGASSFDGFASSVAALAARRQLPPEAAEFPVADARDPAEAEIAADHTAGLLGRALLALGLAVGVAGTVAVVQVAARHNTGRAADHAVETALGLTRAQRAAARLITSTGPAALALLIAGIGSVLASRIEPVGAIMQYETRTGAALNVAIVAVGLAVTVLVVLAAGLGAGILAERRQVARPLRPSRMVERVSRLGADAAAVVGFRFALEPGRGHRNVPVRSAILGSVIGVAGVVAGLVFTASLDRLTTSPSRSAIPFDSLVSDVDDADLATVLEDPAVAGASLVESAPVSIEGRTVQGYALTDLRGRLDVDVEAGRLPRTADEVVLGLRLARETDKDVGDTVIAVDRGGEDHLLLVVGTAVVPPFNNEQLGLNLALTSDGLAEVGETRPFSSAAVSAAEGTDPAELVDRLAEQFEADAHRIPTEVDNLRQLGALPTVVAALVGLIAVIALVNALVVVVRRRRSDLALLRAIGSTSRETGTVIVVMAATIILLGLVVGVPVGLAVGASLWRVTAAGAFVATDALLPWPWVGLVALATIVVGITSAMLPARHAAKLPPASLLRTE